MELHKITFANIPKVLTLFNTYVDFLVQKTFILKIGICSNNNLEKIKIKLHEFKY